jgi:hypothetical protein
MNKQLLDLFEDYKKDLINMNREEVYRITTIVESFISRNFGVECAYKKDIDYIRKTLGLMIACKKDEGHLVGQDLESMKKFLLGLLDSLSDEMRTIGIPKKRCTKKSPINVNVTQNQFQEQQQSQDQIFVLCFESIKKEISEKQLKELKEVVSKKADPEKSKPQIIEKIKSFGLDVCASIIANIITKPMI